MSRYSDDLVCAFHTKRTRSGFYRALPERLGKFALEVAPEKTVFLRFSRFHPTMKRRFTFLGFEFFWYEDRRGLSALPAALPVPKLYSACRRIKEWIKKNRHLPGKELFRVSTSGCRATTTTTASTETSFLSTASSGGSESVRSNGSTGGEVRGRVSPGRSLLLSWTAPFIRPRITEVKHRRVYA